MSEVTTSGEPTVASPETVSVPPAAAPSFGSSRGSGLARGKRPSAPAPATAVNKDAASGSYQPTAIQVVNHQTEYKNPFAPEPVPVAVVETTAKIEQPVASVPAEQSAAETPNPVAVVAPEATSARIETFTPAPKSVVEPKAELKILPPEEKTRPAQSWEIGGQSEQPAASANPRREGRPDFHPTRHADRQAQARGEDMPVRSDERPARSEQPREPRNDFRPREPRREPTGERREQFGERKEQFGERREQPRTFQPKPTPAVAEAKKSGFLGWLKGLFAGDTAEKTPAAATPAPRQDERSGEGRRYEGGNRGGNRGGQYNRGGRGGRGGYRGDNRGENRGPQFGSGPEGQNQGSPESQGQGGEPRRFDDANRGGGRRHHRGGRGRFRGDNRGGEQRSDNGPSSGPTS